MRRLPTSALRQTKTTKLSVFWLSFAMVLEALNWLSRGENAVAASGETDLRNVIMSDEAPCFCYVGEQKLFRMNCSVLEWERQEYGPTTHISLRADEILDGGGGIIDLGGVENFEGLVTIHSDVSSFSEAPLIRNIHVKNGTTADSRGFIIQHGPIGAFGSQYFVVDSCSSTGDIVYKLGGGICGSNCGVQGKIYIKNSYSTGRILGKKAGGTRS